MVGEDGSYGSSQQGVRLEALGQFYFVSSLTRLRALDSAFSQSVKLSGYARACADSNGCRVDCEADEGTRSCQHENRP
ncbi:hypothetical protein GGD46_006121 [Rhizobium lusitanum]|uniref:Uncharacterized protein n=1 Tax=Rhizobium lusitanum TaxID=293958 RepID=A0A7X0MH71_9HYPH|nr:hypothetical protein [Rhizobium lusitanum]